MTAAPLSTTASASYGKTPTHVNAFARTISVRGRTTVSTSRCSADVSAPATTTLGSTTCRTQQFICELASAMANGSITDAVADLNEALTNVLSTTQLE